MNSRTKASDESKRDYWQQQITNWKVSGLSQKQYCESRSVALSTFCYWKNKINNPTSREARFYPLTIPADPPLSAPDPCLLLLVGPQEFKIEIQADFSPATLKKLIAVLEEI